MTVPLGKQDRVSWMTLLLRGYGMKLYLQGGKKRHSDYFSNVGFGNTESDDKGTIWVKINMI